MTLPIVVYTSETARLIMALKRNETKQNGVAYDCRAAAIILRQPPKYKVTWLEYLTCYAKNLFLTNICFRKQNGRQIQIRLIYDFDNVHYVYVTSLIFDIIGCLDTTGHQ